MSKGVFQPQCFCSLWKWKLKEDASVLEWKYKTVSWWKLVRAAQIWKFPEENPLYQISKIWYNFFDWRNMANAFLLCGEQHAPGILQTNLRVIKWVAPPNDAAALLHVEDVRGTLQQMGLFQTFTCENIQNKYWRIFKTNIEYCRGSKEHQRLLIWQFWPKMWLVWSVWLWLAFNFGPWFFFVITCNWRD